jgi:hypothetical protein
VNLLPHRFDLHRAGLQHLRKLREALLHRPLQICRACVTVKPQAFFFDTQLAGCYQNVSRMWETLSLSL